MSTRAGVLGLMLHQTIDHTLLMPPVMPPQPVQGTPGEQGPGVNKQPEAGEAAEAQQNGQMPQALPVSTAGTPVSTAAGTSVSTAATGTPVQASA